MEFAQIRFNLNFFLLSLTASCILFLSSCGSGNSPSDGFSSATGAIAFNVVFNGPAGKLTSKAAGIDCEGQGVSAVEAKIYDPDDTFLVGGGPWDCDVGQGTISGVPAGSGRTVTILGKNADGHVVFRGQKPGINVIAGSQTNAGTVECFAFVPNLQAPADQAAVDPISIMLEWAAINGATEYRFVVYKNNDLNNPVIEDTTSAANCTLTGLSSDTTYYWQVFAVDLDGNTGIGSDIRSFYVKYRRASVTYSAMGFLAGKKIMTVSDDDIGPIASGFETEFEKTDGFLALVKHGEDVEEPNGAFLHSVTLPVSARITRISAYVSGKVKVSLKKEEGDATALVTMSATEESDQIIEAEDIDHEIEEFPVSYFVEVLLNNTEQRLYSVTIDYEYR